MLSEMFKKMPHSTLDIKKAKINEKVKNTIQTLQVPDGLFEKCPKCNEIIYSEDIINNYYICPHCEYYFRIHAKTRLDMILDKDSFIEWDAEIETKDPLVFPGYRKKLDNYKAATHMEEAIITGEGTMGSLPIAIGVMESKFIMGSMGSVVGEKITRMLERATEMKLPVILFCCSGGARMQEGIVSLMQMAKTSQALKRHSEAGFLYIPVLTDPTTGGVTASFAMLGDVILAEPGALIGFAGPRVIEQTIRQKLPKDFQTAEFLLEHGFVDRIVKRTQIKKTLQFIIRSSTWKIS